MLTVLTPKFLWRHMPHCPEPAIEVGQIEKAHICGDHADGPVCLHQPHASPSDPQPAQVVGRRSRPGDARTAGEEIAPTRFPRRTNRASESVPRSARATKPQDSVQLNRIIPSDAECLLGCYCQWSRIRLGEAFSQRIQRRSKAVARGILIAVPADAIPSSFPPRLENSDRWMTAGATSEGKHTPGTCLQAPRPRFR